MSASPTVFPELTREPAGSQSQTHDIVRPAAPCTDPLCDPRTKLRGKAQTAQADQSGVEAAAKSPGELSQGSGPGSPTDKPAQVQSQGSPAASKDSSGAAERVRDQF